MAEAILASKVVAAGEAAWGEEEKVMETLAIQQEASPTTPTLSPYTVAIGAKSKVSRQ